MIMNFLVDGKKIAEATTENDPGYRHIPFVPSSRDTSIQFGDQVYVIQHVRYVNTGNTWKGVCYVDIDLKEIK